MQPPSACDVGAEVHGSVVPAFGSFLGWRPLADTAFEAVRLHGVQMRDIVEAGGKSVLLYNSSCFLCIA